MSNFIANAIVGQSGGPTAAINATLAGVIEGAIKAKNDGQIGTLYGMKNGIEGFLKEDFVNLTELFFDESKLKTLKATPAAALGSCRKRLKDYKTDAETYEKVLEILKKYSIRYFFYIGGNDSMDTVSKLSEYAKANEYDICVVGIPKTIDNDLAATDHTPGFGSAAKFVATSVKEFIRDMSVYSMPKVAIIEIMGRDAGWLTTSAALPVLSGGIGPDLIYLPERTFNMATFIDEVKEALTKNNTVIVAVSEGIRFADGEYVGASGKLDAFGHKQLAGAAKILEEEVKEKIGCKVRSIELNITQRSAAHILSATDINESVAIGAAGVAAALDGKSGVMMRFVRSDSNEYSVSIESADISSIANAVRGVPDEYINEKSNGVTEACLNYLAPLILGEVELEYECGLPKHIVI